MSCNKNERRMNNCRAMITGMFSEKRNIEREKLGTQWSSRVVYLPKVRSVAWRGST